jgi:hypothetical protein
MLAIHQHANQRAGNHKHEEDAPNHACIDTARRLSDKIRRSIVARAVRTQHRCAARAAQPSARVALDALRYRRALGPLSASTHFISLLILGRV